MNRKSMILAGLALGMLPVPAVAQGDAFSYGKHDGWQVSSIKSICMATAEMGGDVVMIMEVPGHPLSGMSITSAKFAPHIGAAEERFGLSIGNHGIEVMSSKIAPPDSEVPRPQFFTSFAGEDAMGLFAQPAPVKVMVDRRTVWSQSLALSKPAAAAFRKCLAEAL